MTLVIPLSGIYLEKTIVQKDTCFSIFIAALFAIAKTRKQPKYPLTDEWIKIYYINIMEYYSVIKRNEIMPFAVTLMDLETVIQSEVSQKDKNKCRKCCLFVESREMVQMNLLAK